MAFSLTRRGFDLGSIDPIEIEKFNHCGSTLNQSEQWQQGNAILFPKACTSELDQFHDQLIQSQALYSSVLEGQECDDFLDEAPYANRLSTHFESLGSSMNEGDDQEIETLLFDAISNETQDILAEDLWMKVSWLSFHEEDASLRFRFSFGVDLHEDVALDQKRQHFSALLSDAVFPESSIITAHKTLDKTLKHILNCDAIHFVERIIYFNSPNGGAYLHHDRERGHAGVVYAQLTGATFWLALSKQSLMKEVIIFIEDCHKRDIWPDSLHSTMREELLTFTQDNHLLSTELESFSNSTLIHLINETDSFIQQLIQQGHGKVVNAGDILLLPQETEQSCCWHSVCTLGEETGQSLSFAIRKSEN